MKMINRIKILVHRNYRRFVHPLISVKKPKFMIIGAQKAGTTSLHSMLIKHPGLSGGLKNRQIDYSKGFNWYHKNFK